MADNLRVKNVEIKEFSWLDYSAFWGIIKGLAVTFKHIFKKPFTINYPAEKTYTVPNYPNYRGVHRLKKDDQGRPKCVACYMCATICPAECITIVAEEINWEGRDKVCKEFVIDELRCIYCGFCEEACPCDAIELTPKIGIADYSRDAFIYDRDKLLNI